MDARHVGGLLLLVAANLLWSGNWVIGRAVRESFDPLSLNFWRWLTAALCLAPFAWQGAVERRELIRRHAGVIGLLALTGIVLFQPLVYLGLKTTTTINAVIINAAGPLFILLTSWILEREKATPRQIAGMLVSFAGIVVIVCRGEPARLAELELHAGDAWILLAMPIWGVYSVLLRRLPAGLSGATVVFAVTLFGIALMIPLYAVRLVVAPIGTVSAADVGAVLYVAIGASVLAYLCWNGGVRTVGPNVAGFTMPLLPAFGTALAIAFLGERLEPFHAVAFATILAGVVLATRK